MPIYETAPSLILPTHSNARAGEESDLIDAEIVPSRDPLCATTLEHEAACELATGYAPEGTFVGRPRRGWLRRVGRWLRVAIASTWNLASLIGLLAFVAAIPVVQLIALGYMLQAAGRLARGEPWHRSLPGLRLAGRVTAFGLWATLFWLPVWLATDVSYSVQLLRPDSFQASAWRIGASLIASAWVVWVAWAAMRGGRARHFLWPQPVRFAVRIWRPSTWSRAADDLWELTGRLHLVSLWWLGLRAAIGALIWIAIPVSMMIIGLRADELNVAGLVGLIGALSLTWVMLHLPLLQTRLAESNRMAEMFNVREVRRRFRYAPWAITISLTMLLALCIPLWLLRIEATPEQLTWLPSLFFVGLMFPGKLAIGAALGYANRRPLPRHWSLRWSARVFCGVAALSYVGTLYIAQFVAWQGIYVMYFQHAVLVPVAN